MELIRDLHLVLDDRVDKLMGKIMALAWYNIAYPACVTANKHDWDTQGFH